MVLGFEMFPRRVQPVLDRWSKGELSESDFLREVDWAQIWGFAAELYLPLFTFFRMHRLPMLALNIDRATNRRVAAQGLASVPSTEREGVGDPVPASSFYRDRLFEWFKKHPAAGQDARAASERFERFVCAQQFWDRAHHGQWPTTSGEQCPPPAEGCHKQPISRNKSRHMLRAECGYP
jgi:hypothetical protein